MTPKEKQKDKYLQRVYGITLKYWKILSKDGCKICGRKDGRLNVDHVHVKGFKKMSPEDKKKYVRSCLCFLCNTGIKCVEKFSDGKKNRKQLEGMVKYFSEFPLKGEIE